MGFSCFGPGGWGWMQKSRFCPKPGGMGVSINFRPQACSPRRPRLGSGGSGRVAAGQPRRSSGERPSPGLSAAGPAPSARGPLPCSGGPGAGFVYSVHAPPAWPIRGQRRLTSLVPRANRGSPCCSAAKARAGEAGPWPGWARATRRPGAGLRPPPLLGTRARSEPSFLGSLAGARTAGVPGPRTRGPPPGRPRIAHPFPQGESVGTRAPPERRRRSRAPGSEEQP